MLAGAWPSGTGLQGLVAAGPVASDQLVDPAAMDPMSRRQLANGPALQHMRLDEIPRHIHRKTPSRRCLLCPDTSVAYVLKPHTPPSVHSFRETFWFCDAKNCSARDLDMAACALCEPGEAAGLVGL